MKGRVVVGLHKDKPLEVEFFGDVTAAEIQTMIYKIRMGFHQYLSRIRQEQLKAKKEAENDRS